MKPRPTFGDDLVIPRELREYLPKGSQVVRRFKVMAEERRALHRLADKLLVRGIELLKLVNSLNYQLSFYNQQANRMVAAKWQEHHPDIVAKFVSNWVIQWENYAVVQEGLVNLALDLEGEVDANVFAAERSRATACAGLLRGWRDKDDIDPRRFPVGTTTSEIAVSVELIKLDRVLRLRFELLRSQPHPTERKPATDEQPADDTPDDKGFVKNPSDKSLYRAANKIVADSHIVQNPRELNAILAKHPEIRRWKPSKQRLCVHTIDWLAYIDGLGGKWADDKHEIECRTAEIRAQKKRT